MFLVFALNASTLLIITTDINLTKYISIYSNTLPFPQQNLGADRTFKDITYCYSLKFSYSNFKCFKVLFLKFCNVQINIFLSSNDFIDS